MFVDFPNLLKFFAEFFYRRLSWCCRAIRVDPLSLSFQLVVFKILVVQEFSWVDSSIASELWWVRCEIIKIFIFSLKKPINMSCLLCIVIIKVTIYFNFIQKSSLIFVLTENKPIKLWKVLDNFPILLKKLFRINISSKLWN